MGIALRAFNLVDMAYNKVVSTVELVMSDGALEMGSELMLWTAGDSPEGCIVEFPSSRVSSGYTWVIGTWN